MGWLDVLIGGVGTGIGGVGQAVAGAREKRMEEERQAKDRALREADLAERRRQFDEGRFTPVETILPFVEEPERVNLRTAAPSGKIATAVIPHLLQQITEKAKQARESTKLKGLADVIGRRATTMPDAERAEYEPAVVDPRLKALSEAIPNFPLDVASKRVGEELETEKLMPVTETTTGFAGARTGKVTPVPQAPAQPFTAPEGYQPPSYSVGPRGRVTTTYKPPDTKTPTEGDKRREQIDRVLRDKGYVPGTPEYNEQMLNQLRTFPVTEGGMVFGGAQLIPPASRPTSGNRPTPPAGQPGGPAPLAKGPTKPIEAAAAQLVVGAESARRASQEVLAALEDPAVRAYIGPYGQYWSIVQRKAPFESAGKIPPGVVRLEQNLSRVKNYTIKLITGAQMSEPEAKRIMAELPDMGQQPDELVQRMAATEANNAMMEARVRELVMRQSGAGPLPPQGEKERFVPGGANDPLGIRR